MQNFKTVSWKELYWLEELCIPGHFHSLPPCNLWAASNFKTISQAATTVSKASNFKYWFGYQLLNLIPISHVPTYLANANLVTDHQIKYQLFLMDSVTYYQIKY